MDWKVWGLALVFVVVLATVIVIESVSAPDFDPCGTREPRCLAP